MWLLMLSGPGGAGLAASPLPAMISIAKASKATSQEPGLPTPKLTGGHF